MAGMDWTRIERPEALKGKTVESVEIVEADFGSTARYEVCIKCSDGTRVMVPAVTAVKTSVERCMSRPPIESMRKAPEFFSASDIAAEVERREERHRAQVARDREQKQRQLERLQKELA